MLRGQAQQITIVGRVCSRRRPPVLWVPTMSRSQKPMSSYRTLRSCVGPGWSFLEGFRIPDRGIARLGLGVMDAHHRRLACTRLADFCFHPALQRFDKSTCAYRPSSFLTVSLAAIPRSPRTGFDFGRRCSRPSRFQTFTAKRFTRRPPVHLRSIHLFSTLLLLYHSHVKRRTRTPRWQPPPPQIHQYQATSSL